MMLERDLLSTIHNPHSPLASQASELDDIDSGNSNETDRLQHHTTDITLELHVRR
jgi:hypothetical protein